MACGLFMSMVGTVWEEVGAGGEEVSMCTSLFLAMCRDTET